MNVAGNFFDVALPPPGTEVAETLAQLGDVAVERIVAHRAASPPDFWYDQDWDEWVMLLRGEAELRMQTDEPQRLRAGDYRLIPRGTKHRVESMSADALWLAVHVGRSREK